MLNNPSIKYRPVAPVDIPDRTWPTKTLTRPPIWMSTDLRDGNQSLFEPMDGERKMKMFKTLVQVGLKEIEVAFPSASQTDFDFVRTLITDGHIPDDVTIEVLTQSREDLIRRTMASVEGAKRAIVHLYNATAPAWRNIVFKMDKDAVKALALKGTKMIREIADQHPETEWTFQYSPECFTATELDFAKEVCNAVIEAWGPTPERKMIINLPATVEVASPNHYADQVEWMHRNLARRDSVLISVHPHNDRGTAIAAAELAVLAGADRIEGCLFGNGERTGNVDLVTLALNMYSQGIHPGLDFSQINDVARVVEECNQLPIHPRHPYVGDLVFTAFSGSHQDAIKKGFEAQKADSLWEVPYLPIDPSDVGRTYDSVIRVNSQSGKGGIAYLLESRYGLAMPRRLQVEFSSAIQKITDANGTEVTAENLWEAFQQEYIRVAAPIEYVKHRIDDQGERETITLTVKIGGNTRVLTGNGNGPLDALMDALQVPVRIQHYEERATGQGADATAVAFAEMTCDGVPGSVFGVGINPNLTTASIRSAISGINRTYARADEAVKATFFAAQTADKATATA